MIVSTTISTGLAQKSDTPKLLAGTSSITSTDDIASELVDGVDRRLLKELDVSVLRRVNAWPKPVNIDSQRSEATYEDAMKPLREELGIRIGLIDTRTKPSSFWIQSTIPSKNGSSSNASEFAKNDQATIYNVRWSALDGVEASGLLIVPIGPVRFTAIVVPDAGYSPEQLVGIDEPSSMIAIELAARGGVIVVPDTIRRQREARNGRAKLTDQEFLYRSAFVLGRHIIGYQVHEISTAIDVLKQDYKLPTMVIGWGEGGWLTLFAAAVDLRIEAACVSGHFGPKEGLWSEPIHRNVHGLLTRFGDAQLAAMIAPRSLTIDPVPFPTVEVPGEGGAPGRFSGPSYAQAHRELELTSQMLKPWKLGSSIHLVEPTDDGPIRNGSSLKAIQQSLRSMGVDASPDTPIAEPIKTINRANLKTEQSRREETLAKWNRFNQSTLDKSAAERDQFWKSCDTSTPERFLESTTPFREYFRTQTVGDWEWGSIPFHGRTRLIYDEPKWVGYEVILDVYEDVIAYGTLLIPRDGKPVSHRPCVVFQHGLEGRPADTIIGDHPAYHDVSRQLVEQGFVVFAPQNLYLFQDRFRTLQRKSNLLGKTLFSTIVAQHRQIVRWLASRDEVDPKRIAFYGLSYGGKSAMRIPALVPEYCLSICSADFNDWVWKNASTTSPYSYVWTNEYEIFEFGLGNHFNYAEMAGLIAPRPFMVERGHFDNVAPDERVGLEFAKVNRLYSAKLKIPDRCRIEWFVGPHTIHGQGTFAFLREHLGH